MIINDLRDEAIGWGRCISARIEWEALDRQPDKLRFEVEGVEEIAGEGGNAFLAACFPLAALHGERRVRLKAEACPMLVDGLRTIAAWWREWGMLRDGAPSIEV